MRKTLIAAAVAIMAAGPAMAAGPLTMSFTSDDGEAEIWRLDPSDGSATDQDGSVFDYAYDDAARTLCIVAATASLCTTFEGGGMPQAVGEAARFSTADGLSGEAKVIAAE
ncbi:MAG: hypothetical protein AAGM38_18295 [Pseudomonadota bacterium]